MEDLSYLSQRATLFSFESRKLLENLNISLKYISDNIALDTEPELLSSIQISVIIPCYNSANFIRPCLEALAVQTLHQSAFEVICVDDCSDDNTIETIHSYQGKIKNLHIVKHNENKKQGAARNTGIDAAKGKFVTFIDSDDFLRPDALELLLFASHENADVVVSQLLKVRYDVPYRATPANRRLVKSIEVAALENTLGWFPVGMLIRRQLLNESKIRFMENVYFEDIEFCIRVFLGSKNCVVLNDQLYNYVQRDGSTVNSMSEKKLTDSAHAMSRVFEIINQRSELVSVFTKTATSWLRLQASRVRDGIANLETRNKLASHFVSEINRFGLVDYLGAASVKEIQDICRGRPKLLPQSPTSTEISCSSPWGGVLESAFAGKVIFFCEVDYHIRSAAPVARSLLSLGIKSLIVDASKSSSFTTNRPLREEELSNYRDLDVRSFDVSKALPFSTEAAAFVFMNDLTYTKRLIMENFGFGVPTFGFYEGINDDWNLDRVSSRMPYRSVDYLLLPGIYQQGFYQDRQCRIVGLPNVRSLLARPFTPAKLRRAIINVNFTYGVLEDRRDEYVGSAVQACQELGLDYVITQHPADKGDLSQYNVSRESVYELLEEGTVLISRFSTTILEALAMGRAVAYHNPIGEKVPKFHNSLGAYRISNDVESLKSSLKHELNFLDGGGEIRKRAALFLHFHCNTCAVNEPEELAANFIAEVLAEPQARFSFKTGKKELWSIVPSLEHVKKALSNKVGAASTHISATSVARPKPVQSLTSLAANLLLDPVSALARLEEPSVAQEVAGALAAMAEDDPLAVHFRRVEAFARSRTA